MAPIDSRLYKPVRTRVIHYATLGTAEPFSKLGWGRGRGRGGGAYQRLETGALRDSPPSNFFQKKGKLHTLAPPSFYLFRFIIICLLY